MGSTAALKQLRQALDQARREQQKLCLGLDNLQSTRRLRAPKVAVDSVFAARLWKILRM